MNSTGPTYKYYITPLKNYAEGLSGYQLMKQIHTLALSNLNITEKVYRPDSKYIQTGITCADFRSLNLNNDTISDHILSMSCQALSNRYILTKFNNLDTCSILEYITDVNGDTKLNTILVFGFNVYEGCIEIIALCSEGGGGTTFNYFLNLVKAALIEINPNGSNYEPKIVLEALHGALRFYNLFGFNVVGPQDVYGITTLNRKISGVPLSSGPLTRILSGDGEKDIEIDLQDSANNEATKIQNEIGEKPKRKKVNTVLSVAQSIFPLLQRKNALQPGDHLIHDEDDEDDYTPGKRSRLANPGADTAGGNMNKIKNKTVNVLFRPFRILTKGSVKKSNKKRSKRRITNKRKTRKNR